jgi:nicotinamide mononucleotide adenylyltransferase
MDNKIWDKKYYVKSSMVNDEDGFAMFLGRWQPLHDGHKNLFSQALNSGKNICIMIRDTPVSEKNPFTSEQVKQNIEEYYSEGVKNGNVVVMVVPNITSINFGRGVGYDIIEHIPPTEIADISATKIREQMKQDGRL